MSIGEIIIAIITALVLIGVVGIRTYSNGKVEVKPADALIAVAAAMLMLFMSGYIGKLSFTPTSLTVEASREAFLVASARPIDKQVSPLQAANLPVVNVDAALKGDVGQIPALVRRELPALEFILGANIYVTTAVQQYLEQLAKFPFFRFVVILNRDKSLFGMIDGRKMVGILEDPNSGFHFDTFARVLNQGGAEDQAALTKLNGFVLASSAVTRTSDKRDTLEKMEKLGIDWLPVVSEKREFEGVVERSRVTASLILDVANQLRATTPEK